jgi:hypothetical protein
MSSDKPLPQPTAHSSSFITPAKPIVIEVIVSSPVPNTSQKAPILRSKTLVKPEEEKIQNSFVKQEAMVRKILEQSAKKQLDTRPSVEETKSPIKMTRYLVS